MSRLETYKEKKTKTPYIVMGLSISFIMIVSSILLYIYLLPSTESTEYFQEENDIIFEGEIISTAYVVDDAVYFPFSFIQEKIDSSIVFDENSNSIIITTSNKVLQLPSESLTYFINEEPFKLEVPALVTEAGERYINIDQILQVYPIEVDLNDETSAIIVQKHGQTLLTGVVKDTLNEHESRLRVEPSLKSKYVAELEENESIVIEKDDHSEYYFIRKKNGIAGYVKKNAISLNKPMTVNITRDLPTEQRMLIDGPINLTWEAVYSKNPDTSTLPQMNGVNVVSPTWFSLKNNEGDVTNLGSTAYSEWAKQRNYQVWAVFSNDFDPEKTHEAFKDFDTRQKIIRQLLQYSQMYELDGINIDIENVNLEDGPLVTQFVREATPYLHEAGLVVSMDVTFISESENWSKFYEREKLADVVDYMMVMAYDEHWASSPIAGSVASFPWVENNLERILEVIPNDRLILGVPLYTRIWEEKENDNGAIEVSSKAHSIEYVREWMNERNLEPAYDEKSGQYYVEYMDEKEQAMYKIWIENDYSLQKRAQIVHSYQLAGIATWARTFGNEDAWTALSDSLKHIQVTQK
ncbi:glycosyl hydrolase family 18 protein [Cytobacillus sp. IB215665]|uniref:glycosyl hydrolase family 18 protein n=1 Tax=Cytobacillus sp. IB215665 TaxID=3097357 RepID=UPI002A0E0827|nr:glycosyl hydrolase family 18 protein [Cytobacillus sp. IB215665]MDX8366950.1 glycosyl hydrolase family 18 protein [Cytobacillus sp. IB215665]